MEVKTNHVGREKTQHGIPTKNYNKRPYIKKIYKSADIPEFPYFTAAILDLDRLPVMRKLAHFFF